MNFEYSHTSHTLVRDVRYLIELSNDADCISSEYPSVSERIRKAISYIKELEAQIKEISG